MNNGQAPPDAWSINAQPNALFVPEVQKIEIPNTANIKVRFLKFIEEKSSLGS